MTWYVLLLMVAVAMVGLIVGFMVGIVRCDQKTSNMTVGDLFITKDDYQPYLAAKIPMENIAERTYVTFEVKVVDDSQK